MPYLQEPGLPELPHKLTLDGRRQLTVSGVKDVESFDETSVVLDTVRGVLIVRGSGLHLQLLSLEGGNVTVDGRIDSLGYEEPARGGFFSRLWGAG